MENKGFSTLTNSIILNDVQAETAYRSLNLEILMSSIITSQTAKSKVAAQMSLFSRDMKFSQK